MINNRLIGELRIMKDLSIKPNFSALQREYGTDRHTIKRYYDSDGIPIRKKKDIKSKWDPYKDEMDEILQNRRVSYKALYMYMLNKYGKDRLPGDYNSLRNFYYSTGRRCTVQDKPHVLYETPPGKQAQFDWKEDLKITLKNGDVLEFNVFSLTLSYSREHVFIYSPGKSLEDFLLSFIKAISKIGGVCDEYLTDNMSSIVSFKNGRRRINRKVAALFKDIGSKLRFCKVKTPQTKGKDENANKFVSWIYPYDNKLESESELIKLIEETITADANRQINTGTNMPPLTLFAKEKEYLKPLGNKVLLETYLDRHIKQKVPSTLLVTYAGNKYSVSSEFVSKIVDIYPIGNRLYIYYNTKQIAIHTISHNRINYSVQDYKEALGIHLTHLRDDEIEKMANENLKRFKDLERNS